MGKYAQPTSNNIRPLSAMCREIPIQKHIQTSNCNPLTAGINIPTPGLCKPPCIARPGIQQHRNKEQINQTADLLEGIVSARIPFLQQVVYARDGSGLEVLPAAVRGDSGVVVWAVVALS